MGFSLQPTANTLKKVWEMKDFQSARMMYQNSKELAANECGKHT